MAEKNWLMTTGSSTKDLQLLSRERGEPRRLLAVSSRRSDEKGFRDYAIELGRRIECEVIMLRQGSMAHDEAKETREERETLYTEKTFLPGTRSDGLGSHAPSQVIEYVAENGDLVSAVEGLCEKIKRIEFILTDSQELKEALSETTMIPIFGIVAKKPKLGGYTMKTHPKTVGKKPVVRTVILGTLAAAMYAAIFWKSDMIMQLFTKGGVYAAFPIVTVFLFSFAHGAFASNLWSVLGIQPKPTAVVHKTVSPSVKPSKTKAKRPRVYAYVNPFHNIDVKTK